MFKGKYAEWLPGVLKLDNGLIHREVSLPESCGGCRTARFETVEGLFSFFTEDSADFCFLANGKRYSGESEWTLKDARCVEDALLGGGATVAIRSGDGMVEVALTYLLYPKLPAMRKKLKVRNLSHTTLSLESVDVERLRLRDYFPATFGWIYSDYGRRKSIGPYQGTRQDCLVTLHNMDDECGILLGNEAPGVVKNTSVFEESLELCVGLSHREGKYPFEKRLGPGEAFEAPPVFEILYSGERTPERVMSLILPDFLREHMGLRLFQIGKKPLFVYNTWEPFRESIDEQLILELAKAAAEAGIREFVIDDGWADHWGDWNCDPKKFPNGLKGVFDRIKSLGMKPGLWLSVSSASTDSRVLREHPEWFVRNRWGETANLHTDKDEASPVRTACFSTGWREYIRDVLLRLIREYGLEYLKLDFAVVTSAYRFDASSVGCCAEDHGHGSRRESLYDNLEAMLSMFDELHAEKPDLFIDCTFEAMGGLQLVDYALLKHAEGDWLANFDGCSGEKTDLRIRNMAWWRSPAVPATALVIGNAQLQDTGRLLHLKSLAGALPILLGDPRVLSTEEKREVTAFGNWIECMEREYGVMSFRQDLPGFGEPMEGAWDGFQRINTVKKNGGIVGVFRQGSQDSCRVVTIRGLEEGAVYRVRRMDGEEIARMTGRELETTGFTVKLENRYDGTLMELRRIE